MPEASAEGLSAIGPGRLGGGMVGREASQFEESDGKQGSESKTDSDEATPEEALDAYCDEVIEAIERNVADVALGPAMTLNPHASSIKLRFDVLGKSQHELYNRVATVIGAITKNTGLELHVDRSRVDAHPGDEEVAHSELAIA